MRGSGQHPHGCAGDEGDNDDAGDDTNDERSLRLSALLGRTLLTVTLGITAIATLLNRYTVEGLRLTLTVTRLRLTRVAALLGRTLRIATIATLLTLTSIGIARLTLRIATPGVATLRHVRITHVISSMGPLRADRRQRSKFSVSTR